MPLRLAFKKTTPDGLAVEVEEYEGHPLLLLTKSMAGAKARAVQVMGIALKEINPPGLTWYYEYEQLPRTISLSQLDHWLESHGYTVGTFDQFGNFRKAA